MGLETKDDPIDSLAQTKNLEDEQRNLEDDQIIEGVRSLARLTPANILRDSCVGCDIL